MRRLLLIFLLIGGVAVYSQNTRILNVDDDGTPILTSFPKIPMIFEAADGESIFMNIGRDSASLDNIIYYIYVFFDYPTNQEQIFLSINFMDGTSVYLAPTKIDSVDYYYEYKLSKQIMFLLGINPISGVAFNSSKFTMECKTEVHRFHFIDFLKNN